MPTTRAATGNSKPRIIPKIEEALAPKKTTKKRSTTKANTSKPRAKKVTSGRVEKKTTTTTKKPNSKNIHVKKSPGKALKDKVTGKAEKAEGEVEGKPGKKAAGTRKEKPTTTKKIAAPGTKKTTTTKTTKA